MPTEIEIDSYYSNPLGYIRGLYVQTASSTPITGTTVETSLLDGGVGSVSVPANGFKVGDSFVASLGGHISCVNNEDLQIRVKAGSVVLGDTGLVRMPQCTNKHWDLQVRFTIRSIGGTTVASIASFGIFSYSKDASNAFEGSTFSDINNTTFATDISNTLGITAQWSSNNSGNSIYSESFILTKIY